MTENTDDLMNEARENILCASAGVLNGVGNPIGEVPVFRTFLRMITPGDELAVESPRDVRIIARGLRLMIASGRERTEGD